MVMGNMCKGECNYGNGEYVRGYVIMVMGNM